MLVQRCSALGVQLQVVSGFLSGLPSTWFGNLVAEFIRVKKAYTFSSIRDHKIPRKKSVVIQLLRKFRALALEAFPARAPAEIP